MSLEITKSSGPRDCISISCEPVVGSIHTHIEQEGKERPCPFPLREHMVHQRINTMAVTP